MGWETEVSRFEQEGREITGYVGAKLRTLFISERAPYWQTNLETGKLDTRKLSKIITCGSSAVFRRRVQGIREDSAVSLIVDHSGSMGGPSPHDLMYNKAEIASALVCAIAEQLENLRIAFEVIGYQAYTDEGDDDHPGMRTKPVVIELIKTWEESYRRVRQNFAWPSGPGENNELPVIQFAARRLWERKETKKIMMIFSDGVVAFGDGLLQKLTIQACKEYVARMERAGIKVVGFGILDDSIKQYCSRTISVNNLKMLAGSFYKELQQILVGR